MSPRRRAAVKRLVLALVVLAICGFPFITLKACLYLVGGLLFVVVMIALGIALDFWKGFPAARPRAVLPRWWR